MKDYIKKHITQAAYETWVASEKFITPNVSLIEATNEITYNIHETLLICKYNVTSTSSPVHLYNSSIKSMKVDNVEVTLSSTYTFDTTGEHTVKYELTDITSIGASAFAGCSDLTSISIPNTVTSIGENAFAGSGLTSITIPDSVTSIGDGIFASCSHITSLTLSNSITSIGNGSFSGCAGLTSLTIPASITSIGYSTFAGCSNLDTIICNAMTAPSISSNTFSGIKLNGTLIVPSGSTNYNNIWMSSYEYYLGYYGWTKVEQ